MPLDTTRPNYIITDTGIVRLTFTDLGPVDQLATQIAGTTATLIPNVFNDATGIAYKQNTAHLSVKLNELKFNTTFEMVDGLLVPTFGAGSEALPLSLVWATPADMDLRLGVQLEKSGNRYVFLYAFLVAKAADQGGFFKLPVPNVYEDSRVCMGNEYSCPTGSLDASREHARAHFMAAPWNTDLLTNNREARSLFRWSSDSSQRQPDAHWTTLSRRVSHPALDYFFI